jgi:serine/threonine protein kinase
VSGEERCHFGGETRVGGFQTLEQGLALGGLKSQGLIEETLDLLPALRSHRCWRLGWWCLPGVGGAELTAEPRPRDRPLALDCRRGHADRRRRVLDREAAEIAQLDDAGLLGVEEPAFPRGASSAQAWVGRTLGAFRIVALVGEGGMGAVYRAVRADGLYERPVALKAIRRGLSTEFFLKRFENERRILARLDHPNIARLLDGGMSEEGVLYVVMEYIDGTPIDQYCERAGASLRQRLALFRTVCGAVQYAHQNLIVHRDLKPANILVTAEGAPKLLDFGIAKIIDPGLEPDSEPGRTLLPMMTPEFASPEQVRGELVTTASDVYSLGRYFQAAQPQAATTRPFPRRVHCHPTVITLMPHWSRPFALQLPRWCSAASILIRRIRVWV